jgi:hypothetical protein
MPVNPKTPDEIERERAETRRKFQEEQARKLASGGKRFYHLRQWKAAKIEATMQKHAWIGPTTSILKWTVGMPIKWLVIKPAKWAIPRMVTKKGEDGHRHFALIRSAVWTATFTTAFVLRSYIAMGAYYYGTLRTYPEVYVPNAGVFLNQQFERPNEPGRIATARDEIHTVHAKRLDDDGKLEELRLEVDSNPYFFWKQSAWRPDLVAVHITPISPFGAVCRLQVTGGAVPVPRAFRPLVKMAKNWLGSRPEIVAASCEQLKEVPSQFTQVDAPETKSKTLQPLPKPKESPATTPVPTPIPPLSQPPAAAPLPRKQL